MKLGLLFTFLGLLSLVSCSGLDRAPRSQTLERALYLSSIGELDAALELFEQACKEGLQGGCLALGENVELGPMANLHVLQLETSDRASVIQYISPQSHELRAFVWDHDELRLLNEQWISRNPIGGGVEITLSSLRPGKNYRIDFYAAEGSFVSSHFFKALATEGVEITLALDSMPQVEDEVVLSFNRPTYWQRELTPHFLVSRLLASEALYRLRLRGLDYYFLDLSEGLTLVQKNTLLDMMAKSRRGVVLVSAKPFEQSAVLNEFLFGIERQVRAPVLFVEQASRSGFTPTIFSTRQTYTLSIAKDRERSQLKLKTSLGLIKGSLNNNEFEVEVK